MTIVGFTGVAQSGKDTAAKVLCEQHGFVRVAFADSLKELALRLNPLVIVDTYELRHLVDLVNEFGWEKTKVLYPMAREFLQDLGEAARDILGEDTWVDIIDAKIQSIWNHPMWTGDPKIVVTDVRFANEVRFIEEFWGGTVVGIERPGVGPANGHVSEQVRGLTDLWVVNDETPEVLAKRVLSVI